MTFTIERVPGEPIIVLVHQSKHMMQEMPEVRAALFEMLDAQPDPMFIVMDIRGAKIDLDDMTQGASLVALKKDAALHHPKIRESLLITGDTLIRMATQGLRTATFGNVRIRSFDTPDAAIAYCREQIAAEARQSQKR